MQTNLLRRFCVFLAAATALSLLAGCQKNNKNNRSRAENEEPAGVVTGGSSMAYAEDGSAMLTGIYTGQDLPVPDGWTVHPSVNPTYDADNACVRYLAGRQTYETVEAPEGPMEFPVDRYAVVTASTDGSMSVQILPTHWSASLSCGAFDGESFLCVMYTAGSGTDRHPLVRFDKDGSSTEIMEDTDGLFGAGRWISHLFLVPEDCLLFCAGDEILLMDGNGTRLVRDYVNGWPIDAGVSADGRLWTAWESDSGYVLAELDRSTGAVGRKIDMPTETMGLRFGDAGGERDFYFTDENGLYGAWLTGETYEREPLVNYANSGINSRADRLCAAADADTFLYIRQQTLTLWRHSPDLSLDDVIVLTVACDSTYAIDSILTDAVSRFQRRHPEARVAMQDYAVYNTKENETGGEAKLATDLVVGRIHPDILIGSEQQSFIVQAREKGLYADLSPYLAGDGAVRSDDLFGCVKRLYEDGRGGMWGITPSFSLRTLFANPAYLGKYAEQGYMSPTDFVDFAESLPEGREAILNFTNGIGSFQFLLGYRGGGLGWFLDAEAGTASFDSPEFIRVLEFLAALPTPEEYRRRSPFADLTGAERTRAYWEGDVVLYEHNGAWSFTMPELWTGTEDWMMIGYPTFEQRAGAGTKVEPGTTVVVLSGSDYPELAWELICDYFAVFDSSQSSRIPALKSLFREKTAEMEEEIVGLTYSGGAYAWKKNPDRPVTEADLPEPGFLTEFGPEKAARLEEMLDEAGVPLASEVPDELTAIVREEVMAYLGGVGTARDCAQKVQSRVSLWLAERQ